MELVQGGGQQSQAQLPAGVLCGLLLLLIPHISPPSLPPPPETCLQATCSASSRSSDANRDIRRHKDCLTADPSANSISANRSRAGSAGCSLLVQVPDQGTHQLVLINQDQVLQFDGLHSVKDLIYISRLNIAAPIPAAASFCIGRRRGCKTLFLGSRLSSRCYMLCCLPRYRPMAWLWQMLLPCSVVYWGNWKK